MYCRIKDEKIIEQYNTLPFRIRIDANTTRTSLYELSEAELNEIGIYKCRIEIPIYNSSTSYLGDIIETYDKINNEYVISYEVVAKTALEIEIEEKEKLDTDISTLKDIRVTKIKDGYVFKEHTYFIDRDDKIDLLIEKNKAEANPLYENYWKTMEGDWVDRKSVV